MKSSGKQFSSLIITGLCQPRSRVNNEP